MGNLLLTAVNFLLTMGGIALVDRKGRKFLLSLGSAGIIAALVCVGFIFYQTEKLQVDCKDAIQKQIMEYQDIKVVIDPADVESVKTAEMSFSFKGSPVARATGTNTQVAIEFNKPVHEASIVKSEVQLNFGENEKVSFGINNKLVKAVTAHDKTLTLQLGVKVANVEVAKDEKCNIIFDEKTASALLATAGDAGKAIAGKPTTMTIIYSCGDFTSATNVVRSDDPTAKPLSISRNGGLPANAVEGFITKNPFGNLEQSKTASLKIDNALITPVPSPANGWLTAICIYAFCAFFAVGPGVCVWLALSELMPTRIRSNGMSFALLLNTSVSTGIAAVFLPTVGKHGYSYMFFWFAGFTVIYFITAAFFLPETKGKTLEEIEEHFEGKKY